MKTVTNLLAGALLDRRLQVATETARAAGVLLLEHFRAAPAEVEYKGVRDIVTKADKESEALIVGRLKAAFPDDEVLAEEGGGAAGGSGGRWVVDPLDGTVNFAHRYPHFAVSIAFEREGRIDVAVVYDPCRHETFAVRRGAAPPADCVSLGVTRTASLDRAIILTGFGMLRGDSPDGRALDVLTRLLLETEGIRRAGAAALDLAYVAAGRADGFYEWGLKPWDVAAGSLLIEAAGGFATDIQGGRDFLGKGSIVASGPGLYPALIAAVRR